MQLLLLLARPAWTYSTWAHYSCRSKGPCQKGATKEVRRRAFIFIIIRTGDVVHKSLGIFFCWVFTILFGNGHWPYPSIHTQEGEVGGACSSSEYSVYGSIWITFLHPYLKRWPWTCFCPWIIFERPILEANRGRLDVRDVLATCEMGIRLLVKAMKRWFWNGNKSGRKSNGKGDYNIKAGGHIPAHHKRLP